MNGLVVLVQLNHSLLQILVEYICKAVTTCQWSNNACSTKSTITTTTIIINITTNNESDGFLV